MDHFRFSRFQPMSCGCRVHRHRGRQEGRAQCETCNRTRCTQCEALPINNAATESPPFPKARGFPPLAHGCCVKPAWPRSVRRRSHHWQTSPSPVPFLGVAAGFVTSCIRKTWVSGRIGELLTQQGERVLRLVGVLIESLNLVNEPFAVEGDGRQLSAYKYELLHRFLFRTTLAPLCRRRPPPSPFRRLYTMQVRQRPSQLHGALFDGHDHSGFSRPGARLARSHPINRCGRAAP